MTETTASRAAKLIAELCAADRWHPPLDLSDHPILGAIRIRRSEQYEELKHTMDFSKARQIADERAIQEIINICQEDGYRRLWEVALQNVAAMEDGLRKARCAKTLLGNQMRELGFGNEVDAQQDVDKLANAFDKLDIERDDE